MNANDWMTADARSNPKEPSTDEILSSLNSDPAQHTKSALGAEDRDDGLGPAGGGGLLEMILEYCRAYWYYVVAATAVVLVALVMLGRLGGEPAARPSQTPVPSASGGAQPNEMPEGEIRGTGIEFAEPVIKDGSYYLRSGEIAWKGKVEETDTGQELTLEGPTAAAFKQAVRLPHGEITTGVFGRAQPDQPIVHGTFQRVSVGGNEHTTGTYYAVRDQELLVEGTYADQRDGDTVVRTYREQDPDSRQMKSYRVSFVAPEGAPIPTLIGWEPPAVDATGS